MSPESNITSRQKRVQQTVFREACKRGCTLKAIAMDSGHGYTTVQTWAKGEAVMSISGLYSLVGVIDDDLLSLLLPDGRQIVRVPEDIDHDAIAEWASEYLAMKAAAHRKDSPGGVDIVPTEREGLDRKVAQLKAA
jgi:hypothetical protein